MNRPSDELLMAYADGVLDEEGAREVADYLLTDESARRFVDGIRKSTALAAAAFSGPMQEPVPDRLIEAIRNAPIPPAPDVSAHPTVVPLVRPQQRTPFKMSGWAWPLAACLALAVGFGSGFFLKEIRGAPDVVMLALGPVQSGNKLNSLLEHYGTGKPLAVNTNASARQQFVVMATFRDQRGHPCREFELQSGNFYHPLVAAVACRSGSGTWTVEGAARLADPPTAAGTVVPSGVSERDALEGLLNLLGVKATLTAQEEQALISAGWK